MKILFPVPRIEKKGWGRELVIHNKDGYCFKILEFKKGSKGSFHFHLKKTETWYVQQGIIIVFSKNQKTGREDFSQWGEGSIVHIPAGVPHKVEALEDTTIFEASTPHEDSDTYRIAPGDSQK